MSRLKEKYNQEIRNALSEKFSYANPMLIPQLKKVVVSMGVTEAVKDRAAMQVHAGELSLITGQKPITTKAKKSIAGFKLREGQVIGAKTTLRRQRMWDFVDRLLNIDAPRIRDFRGFRRKGNRGDYSLGLASQEIFHCLDLDEVKRTQGMNVTFVTTAQTEEECLVLMELLGVPFIKEQK